MARPRKPLTLHRLDGTFRADRHGERSEAQAQPGEPLPTCELTKDERKFWEYTLPLVAQMRVLTVADGEALSRYCRLAARFHKSRDTDEMLKLDQALSRLSRQFGLNPAARASLRVNDGAKEKPKPQDKSRFFTGPRLAAG